MISFAAGFDISYGNFTKRIHANKTLIREDVNLALESVSYASNSLIIYPNPSANYIYIHETGLSENGLYHYKIIDLQGKLLLSGQTGVKRPVNIQPLEKGNYIIRVETEQHRCFYKHISKI